MKVISLILIGLVSSIIWAEEVGKIKGTQTEIQKSLKGKGIRGVLTNPVYLEKEPIVSPEEVEKARKHREQRLKEMGYTPEKPRDVPVSEEDIQKANRERDEMLRKMGIDPNASKISILSEKEPIVSPEEVEKARKHREQRLKEMGYTPEKPRDVPLSEEDKQRANRERDEALRKMGIDPSPPKKADIPPDYKPVEPSKEELEKFLKILKEKNIEHQKELFQKAMEYKEKGQLEEALATFEKMMGTGNSPVIEEAVNEMVKIQRKLGLLEEIEEPKIQSFQKSGMTEEEIERLKKEDMKKLEAIQKQEPILSPEERERQIKEKIKAQGGRPIIIPPIPDF